MTDCLLVLCTCGSHEEAERIANTLVGERLAACVNIVPALTSIYRWQGAVERAGEALLLVKTVQARFAALRSRLQAIHSYDNPEIIGIPIVDGSEEYLTWLREQV